uniref:Response regulator n=1 Tax=candidate division WOR-3 bacterium TaxID=2052148 RepID=A0A7C4UAE2_UNCW3
MRILVVDDDEFILRFFSRALVSFGHSTECVSNGKDAIKTFEQNEFDAVFLDINLPDIDGINVLSLLKRIKDDVIVIMITGINDIDYIRNAMRLGAFDYIIKPINIEDIEILLKRVQDKIFYNKLKREYQQLLEKRVKEATEKLRKLFLDAIFALIKVLEAKEPFHREHSIKVQKIAIEIGKKIGLSSVEISNLSISSLLHDIGKVGIPDGILLKNGSLTKKEFSVIKKHPVIGKEITETFIEEKIIPESILHHHEHFDGSGYPDKLKGENIPLFSRIILIADAIDAMSSNRPYRNKLSLKKITNELKEGAGKQFDPYILKNISDIIERIHFEYYEKENPHM